MTVSDLNWKKWAPLIALAPLIILLLLLFVWPIAGIFGTSFTEGETMFAPYAHALGSEVYRQTFYNTLSIAAVVTIGTIVVSYPLAYVMATVSPSMLRVLTFVVLLPFWTSLLVRTSAWKVLLQNQGVINDILVWLHIIADDNRLELINNATGTIIAMTHILLPFMILPLYANMEKLDGRIMNGM